MFNSQEDYDNFIEDIADRTVEKLRKLLCPQEVCTEAQVDVPESRPRTHYVCSSAGLDEAAVERANKRTGYKVLLRHFNADMKLRRSLWAYEPDLSEFWKAYREECSK